MTTTENGLYLFEDGDAPDLRKLNSSMELLDPLLAGGGGGGGTPADFPEMFYLGFDARTDLNATSQHNELKVRKIYAPTMWEHITANPPTYEIVTNNSSSVEGYDISRGLFIVISKDLIGAWVDAGFNQLYFITDSLYVTASVEEAIEVIFEAGNTGAFTPTSIDKVGNRSIALPLCLYSFTPVNSESDMLLAPTRIHAKRSLTSSENMIIHYRSICMLSKGETINAASLEVL